MRMGTAIIKEDKETDEEDKQNRVKMERRRGGTKKRSVAAGRAYSPPIGSLLPEAADELPK